MVIRQYKAVPSADSKLTFQVSWYLIFLLASLGCQDHTNQNLPVVLDERLKLELILESPDIMTPIGLTIDDRDHVYVLESHTHTPTDSYEGPDYDRIKKGIDEDGDGKPDQWVIWADGINDGMNIEWHDGKVYLVEKDSVFAISDVDDDHRADQKQLLVYMESAQEVYDHAGLLGITVSPDGWVYVSRGNCAGVDLKIVGADGSYIDSYGDGGSIFRFKTDGDEVAHIARGFWNPFDIKFSRSGRLMVVDNDPDSRGPNRLLDIVPGGNYGYESLYGGSGIHPFLAWNGELPGTLPYAAGIGEAPSGLIDASYTNFPGEYEGSILATIWEENSIVNIPLTPYFSSAKGEPETLVQGDSSFHPVALAANSRGDLFITDWVRRQYPNHGYGRVFMLSTASATPINAGQPAPNEQLSKLQDPPDLNRLIKDLASDDPFLQTVSRHLLATGEYKNEVIELLAHEEPEMQMQALLTASQTSWEINPLILRNLLTGDQPDVQKMTLIYMATHHRSDMYDALINTFKRGHINANNFETYLETIKYLQPEFIKSYLSREKPLAKQIPVRLPENYIESVIRDETLSDDIRAIALPYLDDLSGNVDYMVNMLTNANTNLKKALLLSLKDYRSEELSVMLKQMAMDEQQDEEVRAQAILNLELQGEIYCDEIKYLIKHNDPVIAETAGRYLCRCNGADEDIVQMMDEVKNPEIKNIWELCNGYVSNERPATHQEWISGLNGGGNALNGWMIFQSPKAQCTSCHQVDKYGGIFGPDLTNIGASKSKEQLIYAILQPDREIAPEWQGWYLVDKEGTTHFGRQIDLAGSGKHAELMLADGNFVNFRDIRGYGVAPNSLMPDGLENRLTVSEMKDLIAFLMSRR